MLAKVDPYLRPLFDALYDMLDADRDPAYHRQGHRRGRAARVHARPHAERLVHHPRRGAEHEPRADAHVPHAARVRLQGRRDRRRDAGRPAARAGVGPDPGAGHPRAGSTGSPSCASRTRTSSGTSSCSGSSRRTSSTRTRPARRARAEWSASRSRTAAASTSTRRRPSRSRARCSPPKGSRDGELGSRSSPPDEMRTLKHEHLGVDEATDVLSFPIDGKDPVPAGVPRALGDVVLCPQVVGERVAGAARARAAAPARLRPRLRDGGAGGGAAMTSAAPRAVDHRELQLRVRRDHPRAPHAAEHADPLRRRADRADRRRSPSTSRGSS